MNIFCHGCQVHAFVKLTILTFLVFSAHDLYLHESPSELLLVLETLVDMSGVAGF